MIYRILATRSANSIFGAATSFDKGPDGQPIEFTDYEKAEAYAQQRQANCGSLNLTYEAVEYRGDLPR